MKAFLTTSRRYNSHRLVELLPGYIASLLPTFFRLSGYAVWFILENHLDKCSSAKISSKTYRSKKKNSRSNLLQAIRTHVSTRARTLARTAFSSKLQIHERRQQSITHESFIAVETRFQRKELQEHTHTHIYTYINKIYTRIPPLERVCALTLSL